MKFLFIGDIVGKGGRQAVRQLVPELTSKYHCNFVVANGENAAAGSGITKKCIDELSTVVDVITLGDHTWDRKEFLPQIQGIKNVLRPANYSKKQPGRGFGIFRNRACGDIAVINLMGKVFMKDSAYCPFETVENILKEIPKNISTIIVDFHAEATSEKIAMSYFLDGKVTAILGTHTHVQTADAKILSKGTAFMCDVGMVGGDYSILGRDVSAVIGRFTTGLPHKFEVIENEIRLDAVVVGYNIKTGRAESIENISVMSEI